MYSRIKRGDREDTGRNEARPTQGVGRTESGTRVWPSTGLATGDASAFADGPSPEHSDNTIDAAEAEREGLTVHDAMDPELGLTNIGDVPAQDWAADTGETKNAEMEKEPDEEASGSRE